jgi:pSer/pThr/pTyr-binding forkhead associated (FHA) protein
VNTLSSTAARAFALKFISGKYQGGEFPLKSEKQVVIGRSSELDMVLVEDMVSRKHAKIMIASGAITIEDLGSTNGTYLDGQRVTRPVAAEIGGSIRIGRTTLNIAK